MDIYWAIAGHNGIVVIMITSPSRLTIQSAVSLSNAFLDSFLADEHAAALMIDKDYAQLLATMREYIAGGGKRIRPFITLLAYEGYGGTDLGLATPVACSWELLHAGLLVHDDIIDRDTIRHGKPNIAGRYLDIYAPLTSTPDHYALSGALLAGDLLISSSQKVVLQSDIVADDKIEILSYQNAAIFEVGGGEFLDTETALRSITQTNPRLIAKYKTASYSFIYPLLSGACLAGANPNETQKLRRLGECLGIAFQLIDDLLGVFGDEDQTGKTTDGDIRERKHTMLLQETFARASKQDQTTLEQLYTADEELTTKDIDTIRKLMVETEAAAAVRTEAAALAQTAESIIADLDISDEAKQSFLDLKETLLKRRH